MYLFSKKIFCSQCRRKFKGKKEGGKNVYICSTYSNYGADKCTRKRIEEDGLLEVVKKHIEIIEIELRRMGNTGKFEVDIKSYIKRIDRGEEWYTIYYSDGTKSEVTNNRIRY